MIFEKQPCLLPREPRRISAGDQLRYLQAEASNRPMSMILLLSRGKAAVYDSREPTSDAGTCSCHLDAGPIRYNKGQLREV